MEFSRFGLSSTPDISNHRLSRDCISPGSTRAIDSAFADLSFVEQLSPPKSFGAFSQTEVGRYLFSNFFASKHGPVTWGRVRLSADLPDEVTAQCNYEGEIIELNANGIYKSELAADWSSTAASLRTFETFNALYDKLRAQTFLLDLRLNERLYATDGVLGRENRFAVAPMMYDAARRDTTLAQKIATALESGDLPVFSITDDLRALALRALSSVTRPESRSRNEYRSQRSTPDRDTLATLYHRVATGLIGFGSSLNLITLIEADVDRISAEIDRAFAKVAKQNGFSEYSGNVVDFLDIAQFCDKDLLKKILSEETSDGRSVGSLLVESRSAFGRYPNLYKELIHSLAGSTPSPHQNGLPLKVAVCGLGLNEEPITLAILISERILDAVGQPIPFEIHVLTAGGWTLQKFIRSKDEMSDYPYPYEPSEVIAGLSSLFGKEAEGIAQKYFEVSEDKLIPRPNLREKIVFHEYEVGGDTPLPAELIGTCPLITLHNVLQYVKPRSDAANHDESQIRKSFAKLRALLADDGRISIRTDCELDPKISRSQDVLTSANKF